MATIGVARITGVLSLALGLAVVCGWLFASRAVVQVLPGAAPMQFNTAVGLMLAGTGLAYPGRYGRIRLASGVLLAALAVATLAEYAFGIDLGIDRLAVEPFVTDWVAYPGRMAPNTALAFVLTAVALLLAPPAGRTRPVALFVSGLAGAGVLMFGITALLGYLLELDAAFAWLDASSHMPVHTALGCTLVGSGLLAAAWPRFTSYESWGPRWLPPAVGLSTAAIAAILYFALLQEMGRSPGSLQALDDALPRTVLATGLLGAGLLAFAIFQAQRAVQTRREHDRFFALSLDPLTIGTPDGHFVRVNPAFTRTFGFAPRDVRRIAFLSLVHPEDRAATLAGFRQLGEGRPLTNFECRCRTLEGDYRWLAWNAQMADGLVYGVARDVTERKAAEAELERHAGELARHQRRLQRLIEANPDAILVLGEEDEVWFANASARRLLGGRELVGSRLPVALRFDETMELPSELAGGDDRFVQAWSVAIDWQGRRGRLVSMHDMTAHVRAERATRRLQEQLLQAQKMEAIGRLAGGIAHDFNNLLTAILGYSELALQRQPEAGLAAEIEEIRRAAERAGTLTAQLLTFGRRQVVRPGRVDLNELVERGLGLISRVIGEDLEIVFSPSPDLPRVELDPVQLEQVLLNLSINARDAMPHGGRLVLATGLEDRSGTSPGAGPAAARVTLSVTDSGRGMSPEVLAQVFEPFFTTKENGTGLGLATVYGIVQQWGGEIRAESEPDRGATFVISIPPTDPGSTARAPAAAPAAAAVRGGETILVAEDEQAVRKLLVSTLRRHGYEVLEADCAGAALSAARDHPATIDLLLSDVVMPDLRGTELARVLCEERPEMRVLLISGHAGEQFASEQGAAEWPFLPKPFSPDQLVRRVRAALDTRGTEGVGG